MYLDTDVILSQIKKRDWLKEIVNRKLSEINEELSTSAITVVECQIVLLREESREEAIEAMEKIESLGLRILPLTKEVLAKAVYSSSMPFLYSTIFFIFGLAIDAFILLIRPSTFSAANMKATPLIPEKRCALEKNISIPRWK